MKTTILVLSTTLVLSVSAVAEPGRAGEAATVRSQQAFDAAAFKSARANKHSALMRDRVEAGLANAIEIELTSSDLSNMESPEPLERRIRVGVVKPIDLRFDFAQSDGPRGAVRSGRGGFAWTAALRAPGAAALRVRFSDLALGVGDELFVYSLDGQAHGPYTRSDGGELWSNTIAGDEMVIQLQSRSRRSAARFRLAEVGVIGSRFKLAPFLSPRAGSTLCENNAACVENASCASIPQSVQDARDAVAQILFQSGAFFYICSGGLVADAQASETPYFLTANHCLSKGREAKSLEAFFQYSTPCSGTCYDPDGVVPSTNGSSIVSTGRSSDYTLLELRQPAPAGSAFLGWTSTAVANTNGEDLYRISHPSGSPQGYSEHVVDTSRPTCTSWPRGNWIYSEDVFGATEGGSSGSPVVNSQGQIVGQLSGGCGFNINDECDADANATVDGAFAAYYDNVAQWLDPDSGGGGGGGQCTLGQPGDSCTLDSECCSNKCKGRSGAKTCR